MNYMKPTMHGYDVSHWNYTIMPAPGLDDLIPNYPLTSVKATEGSTYHDPMFSYYIDMFRRNGARYMSAYHWIRSDVAVSLQVKNYLEVLRVKGLYIPGQGAVQGFFAQLDWERTVGIGNCSVAEVEAWNDGVCAALGDDKVLVYGSDWVPGFSQWRAAHPDWPVWYANYNTGDTPNGGWAETRAYGAAVWQFTDKFPVPGFVAPVDGNMILDYAVLDIAAGYVTPPIAVNPLPPIIITPTAQRKYTDMPSTQIIVRAAGYNEAFLIPGDYHLSGKMLAAFVAQQVPYVDGDEDVASVTAIAQRAGVSMTPTA